MSETRRRPVQPKERLLVAAMAHVTKHGVGELTLRQLAAAIGTSHRMLVYHFGSKEGLLVEVVRRFEDQQRRNLAALAGDQSRPPIEQMRRMWRRLTSPRMWPRERLFFELYGQALQGRTHTASLLPEIVESWIGPLTQWCEQSGVPGEEALRAAHLALAVGRGLLLDLLTTGDRKAVDATMEYFLANYRPGEPVVHKPAPKPRRNVS